MWVDGTPRTYTLGEALPQAEAVPPTDTKQNDLMYLLSVLSSLALIFRR